MRKPLPEYEITVPDGSSIEEVIQAIRQWYLGPWYNHLPPALQEAIKDQMVEKKMYNPETNMLSLKAIRVLGPDYPSSSTGKAFERIEVSEDGATKAIFADFSLVKKQRSECFGELFDLSAEEFQKMHGVGHGWGFRMAVLMYSPKIQIPGYTLIHDVPTLQLAQQDYVQDGYPLLPNKVIQKLRVWWIQNGGQDSCVSLEEFVNEYLTKLRKEDSIPA